MTTPIPTVHDFKPNLLAVQRVYNQRRGVFEEKEVMWFPRCSRCGAHICQSGRGSRAAIFYRAAGDSEWSDVEPPCLRTTHPKGRQ